MLLHIKVVYKVLITKLRSANTAETRQYRKASKALLVLLPLLGITYLVVLMGPADGWMRHIFDCFRAVLLSTQVSNLNYLPSNLSSFMTSLLVQIKLVNRAVLSQII